MDVTNLNQAQYTRQLAAGCALASPITPRSPLASGNLAVGRSQFFT